ncbi:TolC family protein [Chitinophaga lutea]
MQRQTPHKKLLCWMFSAAFLLAGSPAFAQQDTLGPFHFTLDEAVKYAIIHQNDVVNARLSRQASREKIRETRGVLLPHVDVTGNFTDNLKLQTSFIPDFANDPNNKIPVQFGTKFSSYLTGEATQTLFNSDYFLGLKAAKVYDQLAIRDLERTAIATHVAVSNAYFNVLVVNESIRLADANHEQQAKALKDARARYDEGVAERIDVDRLQVAYNKSENNRENFRRQLEFAMEYLKFQMGMPLTAQLTLEEEVRDFTYTVPDSLSYNVADRPEYNMQRTQIELDRLSLKSKRLEGLPSLNAFINYGVNWFGEEFSQLYKTGYQTSAMGLRLSIPLFTGTERIYQIKQREITLQQSENNLNYLTQQIQLQVKDSWTQYRNQSATLRTEEKNMELTQGIYDRVLLKFNEGVSSSLDVVSADNELRGAQVQYINALINTLISKVSLDQAMGKIKP